MTLSDIYNLGKNILRDSKVDSFSFDAQQILKKVFGVDRSTVILNGNVNVDRDNEIEYLNLIKQRANGRPLQYILGRWNFMGTEFAVGEGVLIPRDDTQVLVDEVLSLAKEMDPKIKILDLCAGSGAIAISIGKRLKEAKVYAIELSNDAYYFLEYNLKKNAIKNVFPLRNDVLSLDCVNKFDNVDIIVSNPPYIPTLDIDALQKEISFEPRQALDGGKHGLDFYKFFADHWIGRLNPGGHLCVEIGINQDAQVKEIFENNSEIKYTKIFKDINGIPRVVTAKKFS